MKISKVIKNIIVTSLVFLTVSPISVFARTSAEIAQEINNQQSSLAKTQDQLNKAKSDLEKYNQTLANTQGGLPEIQAQIKQIEAEIEYNKIQMDIYTQNKNLKELEMQQREITRTNSVKSSYMEWRTKNTDINRLLKEDYDNKKNEKYVEVVANKQTEDILAVGAEIAGLQSEIKSYEQAKAELDKKQSELETKKKELEAQIAYLAYMVSYSGNQINSLSSNIQNIQANIQNLSSEQKAALEREAILAAQGGNNPSIGGCLTTDTTNGGNFYFCGLGRDAYQGHGVGMSQWGAHGMGLKGWNYQDILKFYYTGVSVTSGYEGTTLNVQGYGSVNIETYVAGQGEVPAKACGNAQQASARPDKYVLDNPNTVWDCWPEESIKAQAVAFRTYGYYYRNNICTTAACQVFNGSQASNWAAEETRGQVLTYGGAIIEALYSADNNQGFGTANNDTVFQSYNGNGTAYPYLRAVNDAAHASYTSWTLWGYKSNTYSLGNIIEMLEYIRTNPAGYSWIYYSLSSYAGDVKNIVGGEIASITFERDPSKRVKRVVVLGKNGQTAYIGGYWFKYMWNEWAAYYNKRNNQQDRVDFIFSQSFYMQGS